MRAKGLSNVEFINLNPQSKDVLCLVKNLKFLKGDGLYYKYIILQSGDDIQHSS